MLVEPSTTDGQVLVVKRAREAGAAALLERCCRRIKFDPRHEYHFFVLVRWSSGIVKHEVRRRPLTNVPKMKKNMWFGFL